MTPKQIIHLITRRGRSLDEAQRNPGTMYIKPQHPGLSYASSRLRLFVINAIALILISSTLSHAASNPWQCSSQDSTNITWIAKHTYQKTAINRALGLCKKQSQYPETCKVNMELCKGGSPIHSVLQPTPVKTMWQCSALDFNADPWRSNFYSTREKAAIGSLIFCRTKSKVPDTCYLNTITCRNVSS